MMIQADAMLLPLKDDSVDCIITSPPYFGSDEYETPGEIPSLGTEGRYEDYVDHMVRILQDSYRVLKKTGVMWLILGDLDDHPPISMAPQRVAIALERYGWIIVQEVNWVKTYRVPGRVRSWRHPEARTEKVYLLAKDIDHYRYIDDPMFRNGNVWDISPARHIAGKWAVLPDKLIEKCIFSSTVPTDIVLDPFCGTGSVPRVAYSWDRIGIGSDICLP